jgi:hypothetical protein
MSPLWNSETIIQNSYEDPNQQTVKNYYRYRVIDGDAQELKTGHAARVA